jgi:hypothetical protein
MENMSSIRWGRVASAGLFGELFPFLLLAVAASIYGAVTLVPEDEIRRFAERAGDFVGPVGGAAATFVAARWAARGTTRPVTHGLLVGGLVLLLGAAVIVAADASFRALFVASYATKLLAGWLGGRVAHRSQQADRMGADAQTSAS